MAEEKTTPPMTPDVERDEKKNIDPALEKHAQDADEAMKAFRELQGESITLDESTNKRLLRIIDWHMMPIMCFVYGMNYLDSEFSRAERSSPGGTDSVQRQRSLMRASWV